jgi:site-specific DNA-methyltransferase (adenine-specific)
MPRKKSQGQGTPTVKGGGTTRRRVLPLHHPADVVTERQQHPIAVHTTEWGRLYQGDCLDLLRSLPDGCVDMVFADPPFNLGKKYGDGISDQLRADDYLRWSKAWLTESVRVLAPGGALFVFNLPRWLIEYGAFLNQSGMLFRHWIAMRMPKAFPRGKRLSPAHYGCVYYTKGEPKTFNRVFVPIQTCRHCKGEIRDYGGHRKALNERGINLMDVVDAPADVWRDAPDVLPSGHAWVDADDIWDDIPPVRHGKYKTRGANELAPLMLERLIALSTNRGDLVIDPFGGSGTTFYAAERLERRWLGTEIGDVAPAIRRLTDLADGSDVRWERSRGPKRRRISAEQLGFLGTAK